MPSDTARRIVKLAESYGFKLVRRNKHLVFKHTSGKMLVTSFTCSDGRALRNVESNIKQILSNNDSDHCN
jgi:predicted RNA binding protein YcfA (HicA-like mRNA interferase family)